MDRLSHLPDSIIFRIFWFLPMNDVVRTTILSKRWKDLWTTSPFLNFDESIMDFDNNDDAVRTFVHRVLSRWDGIRVLKFQVSLEHRKSIHGDMDLWVRFAMKYEVEELFLRLAPDCVDWDPDYDHEILWVPQFLYSCSSVKALSIGSCYFKINRNVQWNQLKCLKITEGFGITDHVVNQILSGSPRLEVLIMSYVEREESLCIRSTSLKKLFIKKYIDPIEDPSVHIELRIWTPNLETLELKGIAYTKCLLMNVSSLTRVTLGFSGVHSDQNYCDFSGIDGFSSTNRFLGDLFCRILPIIQHVENITLQSCCFKVLGAMIEKCMNSSSPNVKSLHLEFHYVYRHALLVGKIEIFPQIKKLVLTVRKSDTYFNRRDYVEVDAKSYLKIEAILPKSFVLQLRTVEVTWVEGENIYPFLEFLLKHASKLEKMVFRVKETTSPSSIINSLLLASQKLLKMPRSSRAALFTFSEY